MSGPEGELDAEGLVFFCTIYCLLVDSDFEGLVFESALDMRYTHSSVCKCFTFFTFSFRLFILSLSRPWTVEMRSL